MITFLLLIIHFIVAVVVFGVSRFLNSMGELGRHFGYPTKKEALWQSALFSLFWEIYIVWLLIMEIRQWWLQQFDK